MAFDFNKTFGPGAFAAGGLFGSMFGGGGGNQDFTSGPNRYLDQISKMLPGYYQPWINQGQDALNRSKTEYDWLTKNPGAMYDKFASGYEQSPGFKFQLEQALGGANQAAAAGGMAGSPMSQQWGADIAQNMTQRDFQNYMDRVLGMYGTGLQGEQGLANTGFNASSGLGQNLAGVLGSKAQLGYNQGLSNSQSQSQLYAMLAMLAQMGMGGMF